MRKKISIHKKITTVSALALSIFGLSSISNAQDITYSEPQKETILSSYAEESLPLYDEATNAIYFVRTLHQDNTGGKKSGNEIWSFSKNERNEWVRSEDDFSAINNKYSNAIVGVVDNADKVYLLNQYSKGGEMKAGLSTSLLRNEKWTAPKNVKLNWLNKELSIYNIYVNQDESIMLLSMQATTPDSTYSIYISENKSGVWSEPTLVGGSISSINSDEISPYLSENGRYIYFSSNRDGGKGDFDIYRAEKKGGSLNWSAPVNLESINSSSFDAYYSDGKQGMGYFVSNRGEKLANIYSTRISSKMDTIEMKDAIVEKKEATEAAVVSLHPNVNFAFDEYALNKSATDYLDEVADSLKNNKKWRVELEGHTDNVGSNQYNRNLARYRALSVRNYLIMKGTSAGRIKIYSFGEREPTATNKTQYGRYQNRRVEITFKK